MKRRYQLAILVFLFLLSLLSLLAQTAESDFTYIPPKKPLPPTSGGIFIGLIESEFVGNLAVKNPEQAPRMDLYFHLDFPLNQYLGIRPELRWIGKGGSMIVDNEYFDINLRYLEVPVSLTASYRYKGMARLYAMAGPTIGLKTSSRYLWDGYLDGEITDIETLELGYTYGIGLSVLVFAFELRFGRGFTDIVEDLDVNNFKNKYFSFTFGIGS